jgi:hypothetical protein
MIVAIDAEQFPIASIGRIIGMVVILMVNGQLLEASPLELPATTAADMGKQFQGLCAVPLFPLEFLAAELGLQLGTPSGICRCCWVICHTISFF